MALLSLREGAMNLSQFVDKYGTDGASTVIREFANRFLAHRPTMQQELVLIADNLQSGLRSLFDGSERLPE